MPPTGPRTRLTQKQDTFCLQYFETGNATQAAIAAGYSRRTAQAISSENLFKPMIIARLEALRQKVEDDSVAGVLERKQILTEVARGNLLDYQETGADGGYLSIGRESPNTRCISEITSRTEYDSDGTGAALVTKVKLHSPVQAIDMLNKMDGAYAPERHAHLIVSLEKEDLTDDELDFIARGGDIASRGSGRITTA